MKSEEMANQELTCGCMGPSMPSKKEVDDALDMTIELLQKQLNILNCPENKLVEPMRLARKKALFKLRQAIGEILWQDACEIF